MALRAGPLGLVWSGYLELNQDYDAPDVIGCHTPPTLLFGYPTHIACGFHCALTAAEHLYSWPFIRPQSYSSAGLNGL